MEASFLLSKDMLRSLSLEGSGPKLLRMKNAGLEGTCNDTEALLSMTTIDAMVGLSAAFS